MLLEVGPGQNLATLARQHPAREAEQSVLSSLPHAKQTASSREFYLLALGRLWQSGVDIDWKTQYANQQRRRLHLPGYPFEGQRYWISDGKPIADPCLQTDQAVQAPPSQASHGSPENDVVKLHGRADTDRPVKDGLAERVIQQQLNLMRQQLEAWNAR